MGKTASLVRWVIRLLTVRSRMSHRCSMQAKSGNITGHSIIAAPFALKSNRRYEHDEVLRYHLGRWNFDPFVEETVLHEVIGFCQCIDSCLEYQERQPDQTITLPPLYAVVSSRCRSLCDTKLGYDHRSFEVKNVTRQKKKRTCDHCFHLPWRLQNCCLSALCRGES